MNVFLRIWSFISSPLLVPLAISLWFLSYAGNFSDPIIRLKIYVIALLTVGVPLLMYAVLYTFKLADSIHLSTTKERLIPLMVYGLFIIAIIRLAFDDGMFMPLYFFFIGILMSTIIALILALFQFKISLHMMSIAGALSFVILLGFYLNVDLIYYVIGLSIATGLTATSRLSMKAHTPAELIFGTVMGIAVQVVVAAYYI
ncbi:hypothetical protein SAMN05192588_2013 [Nonlabens sp. Hel1_33_55]|uniref:hypothetical protein n=1 Tax=Nonlabens sp. Hel1_33_55 TaxID=1336802 RepID=UPI000875C11E|nr:hypothetical protein [Nonlabens sp. Hel1_33_55]SCY27824.1 hypothetical protein SAMN05192588_2013 [Nonlabens sp. Hel1_33_55]